MDGDKYGKASVLWGAAASIIFAIMIVSMLLSDDENEKPWFGLALACTALILSGLHTVAAAVANKDVHR